MVTRPLKLGADLLQEVRDLPGVKHAGAGWYVPPDVRRMFGLPRVGLRAPRWVTPPTWDQCRKTQQDDLLFIRDNGGALVAHPTSGGKSLVGLSTAAAIPGPALFVGPALSRYTWAREVKKWYPDRSLYICRGQAPDPYALNAHEWVFCGIEVLSHWGPALGNHTLWQTLIIDEAHELRSRRTQRNRGMRDALGLSTPVVVALSATPLWSKIADLWNVLSYVRPGWFGSESAFRLRYAGAVETLWGGLKDDRATNALELKERLKYTMRRLPKSVLLPDLPPLRRHTVRVSHSAARDRMRTTAQEVAVAKLPDHLKRNILAAAARRETVVKIPDLVREAEKYDRIVVMTQLRDAADRIAVALDAAGWPVVRFHGGNTVAARMGKIEQARKQDRVAVCCTGPSIRQSVDCTGFDAMFFVEFPWTAEELIQMEGRGHRHGIDVPIDVVYVVVDDSFDAHNVELILSKMDDRQATVGPDDSDGGIRAALREPPSLDTLLARFGCGTAGDAVRLLSVADSDPVSLGLKIR